MYYLIKTPLTTRRRGLKPADMKKTVKLEALLKEVVFLEEDGNLPQDVLKLLRQVKGKIIYVSDFAKHEEGVTYFQVKVSVNGAIPKARLLKEPITEEEKNRQIELFGFYITCKELLYDCELNTEEKSLPFDVVINHKANTPNMIRSVFIYD